MGEKVTMTVDEYEVIRLVDLEKCTHEQCAERMEISRTTVTEIYESARYKLADSVVNGKRLYISGGNYQLKLYDIENGEIKRAQIVDTNGQGHGALAGFLTQAEVDVLICGGIGGGAQTALKDAGIQLYGGVNGNADEAVEIYLKGKLDYNSDDARIGLS